MNMLALVPVRDSSSRYTSIKTRIETCGHDSTGGWHSSSRYTSIKTRIETFKQCVKLRLNALPLATLPSKQGLKLCTSTALYVVWLLPLATLPSKQGLKLVGQVRIKGNDVTSRYTSIKTRIETSIPI